MPLVLADRVKETTTTVGTGTITLAGPATGFRSFSVIGDGNTTYYTIAGSNTSEWEVGIGTYTVSGTTLSRDTVLASSAGAPTKTNFSAGIKDVFVTYTAARSVNVDGSSIDTFGLGASAGQILYASATDTFSLLAAGTSGQVLTSGGAGAPSWTAQSALSVGSATTATTATTATNQSGGTVNATTIVSSARYTRNTTGGINSPSARFALTTSQQADYHIASSVNGSSPTNTQQYGITFSPAGGSTQAGILISENGSDGTAIGLFCTNSYAAGPQLRVTVAPTGNVGLNQPIPVARLDISGNYASNIVSVPVLDIDCSAGNYFIKTISGASSFTFSNVPASRAYSFTLELTVSSGSVTWPGTVRWPNNITPSFTVGATNLFMFVTDDGGARWRGAALVNYTT